MKKASISFESIPRSARSSTTLAICLKCAFDFFTRQLKLSPRTAYSELKRHTPREEDFSGSGTSRPHFFEQEAKGRCPYCNAPKRWFARFHAIRIDAYPSVEKYRKKVWTELKKKPENFALWKPERTRMEIFSEWLERLNRGADLNGTEWLLSAGLETVKRSDPAVDWDEVLAQGVRRIQVSRETDPDSEWSYDDGWLYVSPVLYGDILLVQHLISRSHMHGGRTFEGRLTLHELIGRLRRLGYLDAKNITSREPYEVFEELVSSLVASGPDAVYYAVDRRDYLESLKSVYEKKRDK
jgi:hypothetical protein